MHINVIVTKEAWSRTLKQLQNYDFVHTFDFHKVSQSNGEGSPILFSVFDDESLLCAWPALKREIIGTDYFDLSCVYGYGGPIFKSDTSSEQRGEALSFLFGFLKDKNFISIFSRMHPLLPTNINTLPDLHELSNVVIIDLGDDPNSILSTYKSNHRYDIRKALRAGVQVVIDYNCNSLPDFINIYQAAMRDLNATDYYQFSLDYFNKLKDSEDFKIIIINAIFEEKTIASSMFIITNNIQQYYLSGSVPEYRNLAASKAIIAKAHEVAIEHGLDHFVLGGGVGSKEDPLFKFKKGFSEKTKKFSIFKKILNQPVYEKLCKAKNINLDTTDFFPAYRA